jgi:hypothetical protein
MSEVQSASSSDSASAVAAAGVAVGTTSSSAHETVMRQIQLPSELEQGGVWGMFELHRRQTVLLNGVALVREAVDGDSEFVFDVYHRHLVDDAAADVPVVEFDSDLGRTAAALSAAHHAHVDDDEDLDAVQHEYPGPSDEEADDEIESAGLPKRVGARHDSSSDDEAKRNDPVLIAMARRVERLSLMPRNRARGLGDDENDDDDGDDDDELFTTTADDALVDVVEREFYFGGYDDRTGEDDDYDADDAHFADR